MSAKYSIYDTSSGVDLLKQNPAFEFFYNFRIIYNYVRYFTNFDK